MLGERRAIVQETSPFAIHGAPMRDVTLVYEDGQVDQARLGQESAPADLRVGERVLVRSVMRTIVEIVRHEDGAGDP